MPVNLDSHFVFNMNILNVQIFFSHTAGTYEMYENLYHMKFPAVQYALSLQYFAD